MAGLIWRALNAELDAWSAAGTVAEFWWRDDDAADATPALRRLLALRRAADVPLAVAAIPRRATPALVRTLERECDIDILQHGWAHADHAPAGAKKAEFGEDRDPQDAAREIAEGRSRLHRLFGRPPEALVPPWNRIGGSVAALLPDCGIRGLSRFGPRPASAALTVVNAHIDIIDWKGTRGFAGEEAVISAAVAHLADRRRGRADPAEPTGLLTHHPVHDEDSWNFLARFLRETAAHPAVRWRRAGKLFGRCA